MKSNRILTHSIAALLVLAPFAAKAAVDTLTGTGGATQPGVSWAPTTAAGGTIGVWSLGAIPGAGDNAVISATGLIDIRGSAANWPTHSTEIQDLTFNSTAAVTLNNNSSSQDMLLILNGGRGAGVPLISSVGNFAYTIQGPGSNATAHPLRLQINASGSIDVPVNILTITSAISESGSISLNKTGAGTLVLGGNSTFTDGLTHSAGILRATTSAGALGAGTLTLTGAELQLANDTGLAFNRPTIVIANTQVTSDRLASGAGVVHTLGTLSIGAQALTIAPGALATGATAGVTFGATTLTGAATFSVTANSVLTLGATDVGANLLTTTGAGPTTIGGITSTGSGSLAVTGTGITTVNGVINVGTGGFIRSGTGRSIITGTSTFATGVTLNNGVTEITSNGALGTGATDINTGATLEVNLANARLTTSALNVNSGSRIAVRNVTMNNAVTLAGGTLGTRTGDVGIYAGPVNVTADSIAQIISYSTPANNQSITISGKLSGASALAVTGGATANNGTKALILTNPTNDFSGTFNVTSGQRLSSIPAATGNTLGTATVNLTGGFFRLNDNGTGNDGTLAYGNNISVGAGGGTIDIDRVSGANTGNTFALGTLTSGAVTTTINNGVNGYKASFTGGTLTGSATISSTGTVAINGPVTGGFGLTKSGAGTLTLAGANGYTGTTTVGAGTLNLTGSVAAGVAVGANATLTGNGVVTGTTTVANNGIVTPTGALNTGNLTFGAVAADTATVNFSTDGAAGNINVGNAAGLVTNGAAGTVALKLLTTLPSIGAHTIIDYSGVIGGTGFSAFALAPMPNPRIVATLDNDLTLTRIVLNVTAVDAPRWSGALSGEWSTAVLAAPKNWNLIVNVGTTDFITGDNVLFAATSGNRALALSAGNVTPASIVFDNDTANPYSLGGAGAILGTTGLVKTNSGTVTISNTNSFTGPVSISTGTVSVNSIADSAAPSALGAGTTVNIASGGTLEFTGATGSTNRAINIGAGGGTVKVVSGSALTLAGAVTATGVFTLENAGTATVSGAIGGLGAIVNNAGTATVAGNVATSLTINGAGGTTVSGNITAAGTLTKNGTGTATLTGGGNAPTSVTISGGVLKVGDGVAVGSIGTGVITNNATLAFDTPAAGIILGSSIVGTGAVTKSGASGNTVFNGAVANTYSGDTTVSAGNLILSKNSGVNAIGGNLIVAAGGTVSYGTTAGQLQDHIPDGASIIISGGTFGSGAGNTEDAPTQGVLDTVGSVTISSGKFLSGRGLSATPLPFVITGSLAMTGGTTLVQRGGGISANSVSLTSPAALNIDGGSATANNQSKLSIGAGGLTLTNGTINFNAGPSVVGATSVGSIVVLGGNVVSTGTSTLARLNPTLSSAVLDLGAATRTFNVTGTLAIGATGATVNITNGGLLKTGTGTLILAGTSTYAGGATIDGGTLRIDGVGALGTAGGVAINNNAILQASAPITTSVGTVLLGAGGGRLDTDGNAVALTAGTTITGTALTKIGAGKLTIGGGQTYDTLTTSAGRTDLTSAVGTGTSTINANAETNSNVSQTLAALNIGGSGVFNLGTLPAGAPEPAPESFFSEALGPLDPIGGSAVEIVSNGGSQAVPEPGSAALLIGGIVTLLGLRRRHPNIT